MPNNKKKKSGPFSLESFDIPAQQVPIWTDSRDRIPVPGNVMDNPFTSRARNPSHLMPGTPMNGSFAGGAGMPTDRPAAGSSPSNLSSEMDEQEDDGSMIYTL